MDDTDYNLKNIRNEYNGLSQFLRQNQRRLTNSQKDAIRERLNRLEELLELFKRSGPPGAGVRASGKLRPSVQSLLNSVGDEPITSLKVWRRVLPYSKVVKFLIPNVSPDKLYHTAININGKYNLEKDGTTIAFTRGGTTGETLDVNEPSNLTIKDLFEKTRKRMGDSAFTAYTVEKYNCQNFVDNILSSIGSNSSEAKKFVNQDVEKVIEGLGGKWVKALASAFQNVREAVDVVQEGGGNINNRVAIDHIPLPDDINANRNRLDELSIAQLREYRTRLFDIIQPFLNQVNALGMRRTPRIERQIRQILEPVRFLYLTIRDIDTAISEFVATEPTQTFEPSIVIQPAIDNRTDSSSDSSEVSNMPSIPSDDEGPGPVGLGGGSSYTYNYNMPYCKLKF